MKIDVKKAVFLALSALLLYSCGILSNRYDPLERGRYVYMIESFYLPQYSNSAYLHWDAWGKVDKEDLEIYVSVPPSLNMETENLVAEIHIYNAGLDGDYSWYSVMTDPTVWGNKYHYTVSRHDFDTDWEGEALYEVEYDIRFYPVFESSLWLNSSFYSSENNFDIELSFNDTAAPGILESDAFIAGLEGTNCTIPADQSAYEVDYTGSTLPNIGSMYSFSITAETEGEVTLQYSSGAVLEDETGTPNISSNEINMYYDASPPEPSSTPFTIDTNDSAPDILDDIFLDIDYSRGSDSIQSDYNIEYLIIFSYDAENVEGDVSDIAQNLWDGDSWQLEWWSGYDEDFYRILGNLSDSELYTNLDSADPGSAVELYFNILLKDYAYPGNTTLDDGTYPWNGNTALYSSSAVPVTFPIPTL